MVTMMFWHDGGGWPWWQAGLMWLAVIAFLALLIWVVYALVTGISRQGNEPERGEQRPGSARRILDERLARGEIDAEEYRRLRETLDGGTGRSPAGTGGGR
jgi:putative membrane protein